MLDFVSVLSTELDSLKRRIVKFLRYGLNDVQTSEQVAPFGIDSNPVAKMIAIYGKTSTKGETVILGFINENMLAGVGEFRTFSTDSDGEEKFYTWLKNDGTMEIGGNTNNLTRYQELETAFNQLKQDHNDLVNLFNAHMHPTAGSGPPSPQSGAPAQPSAADISGAKIEEIKTL